MTDSDVRPVWLTEDEIYETDDLRGLCRERFEAAPADPAEAACDAVEDHIVAENGTWSSTSIGRAVLRALGHPDA